MSWALGPLPPWTKKSSTFSCFVYRIFIQVFFQIYGSSANNHVNIIEFWCRIKKRLRFRLEVEWTIIPSLPHLNMCCRQCFYRQSDCSAKGVTTEIRSKLVFSELCYETSGQMWARWDPLLERWSYLRRKFSSGQETPADIPRCLLPLLCVANNSWLYCLNLCLSQTHFLAT